MPPPSTTPADRRTHQHSQTTTDYVWPGQVGVLDADSPEDETTGWLRDAAFAVPAQPSRLPDGRPCLTIGNVRSYAAFNHLQGDNPEHDRADCGIVSCADVLNQFGVRVTEAGAYRHASRCRELHMVPGDSGQSGWTLPAEQAAILTDYGVPARAESDQPVERLALAVQHGYGVIAMVNCGVLWSDPQALEHGQANHAVTITGVARDRYDGVLLGFYINDSGTGQSGEFVSTHLMTTAFEHEGGFCVVTECAHDPGSGGHPEVARRVSERKAAELRPAWGPLRGPKRFPPFDDEDRGAVHSDCGLLIAAGGRYRLQYSHETVVVCDGQYEWDISDGMAHRRRGAGPGSKFRGLLTPQWLIACYELQITGVESAGGRTAIQVTGTPRWASSRRRGLYHLLDRVEVLIDAELGILLRSKQIFDGEARGSAELRDLVLNPPEAGLPGLFAPPPGIPVEDEEEPFAHYQPRGGIGWQVAGVAADAAANALGFAVRHAPRRKPHWGADDEEPEMPGDAVLAPQDWEHQQPPDDQTVNLLHRTGLSAPALIADVHEWIDVLPSVQRLQGSPGKAAGSAGRHPRSGRHVGRPC